MFKFLTHKSRLPGAILGTLGATTLALLVLSAQANAANLQQQMQQLADNAALVGVNALGTSEAQAEAERRQQAIDASNRAIAEIPGAQAEVTASVSDLTVTVKLAVTEAPRAGATAKTVEVASTARYVAPDQASNFSWASRQHFAAGQRPVVAEAAAEHRLKGY